MRRNPPSTIYRFLDQPSTQIIQTLDQAAHPLFPNTIHTIATITQTHIPLSPCSSRIGKAKTQSCHPLTTTPPNLPRAKHIHMSHTPHTPLTSLISSTSPALAKTPEPRVPLIYALTATTLPPNHTPALPSPSHHNSLAANTHATQTTVHASQSP